jgi:hypothetical protein
MISNEQELLEGLRALAGESPRQAPARVEQQLVAEFQRRAVRRRRRAWLTAASAGTIAAAVAILLWMKPATTKPVAVSQETPVLAEAAADFYPLPEADALPPVESALVVRVQLPMSSLRLIGLTINEERATERIEADVLLGQDGLARGVRLVE